MIWRVMVWVSLAISLSFSQSGTRPETTDILDYVMFIIPGTTIHLTPKGLIALNAALIALFAYRRAVRLSDLRIETNAEKATEAP